MGKGEYKCASENRLVCFPTSLSYMVSLSTSMRWACVKANGLWSSPGVAVKQEVSFQISHSECIWTLEACEHAGRLIQCMEETGDCQNHCVLQYLSSESMKHLQSLPSSPIPPTPTQLREGAEGIWACTFHCFSHLSLFMFSSVKQQIIPIFHY